MEAQDKVAEVKVDVTEVAKEIGPSQKWNVLGVASTVITQENVYQIVTKIVARSVI